MGSLIKKIKDELIKEATALLAKHQEDQNFWGTEEENNRSIDLWEAVEGFVPKQIMDECETYNSKATCTEMLVNLISVLEGPSDGIKKRRANAIQHVHNQITSMVEKTNAIMANTEALVGDIQKYFENKPILDIHKDWCNDELWHILLASFQLEDYEEKVVRVVFSADFIEDVTIDQ